MILDAGVFSPNRPAQSSQIRSNFKSEYARSLEPLLSVTGKLRGDASVNLPSGIFITKPELSNS